MASAQQLPDREFRYEIEDPAYPAGRGPKVLIDATRGRYVARGSFDPFAALIADDGFQVEMLRERLTAAHLESTDIFAVVNPTTASYRDFSAMEPPSAYSGAEIEAIVTWVAAGGRLLLVADHAPFAGAASRLAESLGFVFLNAYVLEAAALPRTRGEIAYRRGAGLNGDHPITNGTLGLPALDQYVAFTGQAFLAPAQATPLLTIPDGYAALVTHALRAQVNTAPRLEAAGYSQGSAMALGAGRMVVLGEAGGLTAQIVDGQHRFGMNVERARTNALFALAVMRWLAGFTP